MPVLEIPEDAEGWSPCLLLGGCAAARATIMRTAEI